MNKTFVLLYFVLSSIAVLGQATTWSLQQCMETGLQNNLDLKVKRLAVSKAEKEFFPVLLTFLPSANFTANHSYNLGSTIDPATNSRVSSDIQYDNFYLSSSMPVLSFKNLAQSKSNKIAVDWAVADEAVVAYEYKLQLIEKYFDALYTQELVSIQKQQFENTRYNADRISKEYTIGKRPKSDVYDMQLSYSQEVKNLQETEQLYQLQLLQLFQLMNLDVPKETVTLLPVYMPEDEGTEANNPVVNRAELDYEMSLKNIAVQRAALLPTLGAFYTFSSFYSRAFNGYSSTEAAGFQSQLDVNKNHTIGLELNVPLFNGFKNSRAVKVAKIESEQKKIASESERIKIAQQLQQEEVKKQQYVSLQETLDTTVAYAQKSFVTTQAKFETDQVEAVTFSSVKNQLLTAQYNVLKNNLLLQFTKLKISLIKQDNL